MRITGISLRDFRCYAAAEVAIPDGLTVVAGPNGAGKTNLLEAIYFGCTARSCRTANEREVVRVGTSTARVVVSAEGEEGSHELAVGFRPGEPKRMRVDGVIVERLLDHPVRPLVSVFLPDRLELIKGPPALRRAHLDQFVTALWPARSPTRRAYAAALAQRNALISRLRAGGGSRDALTPWDHQLARYGVTLMEDRAAAVQTLLEPFVRHARALGLDCAPSLTYRARSSATSVEELAAELAARVGGDIERGFTSHGPHRDELGFEHETRDLRVYGSQGQQRLAVLALLLAERGSLADVRGRPPVMLLDDVMSELDHDRPRALVGVLRDSGGQSLITTTDIDHVPGACEEAVARIAVGGGRLLEGAPA